MSTQLPFDLISDILCKLPVKDLLRFKCVKKSWCSHISNPDFIKLHLTGNSIPGLLFYVHNVYRSKMYYLQMDSPDNTIEELNCPYETSWDERRVYVFGTCNGLVALFNYNEFLSETDESCVLWNPLTREQVFLPKPWHPFVHVMQAYGFGYDAIKDDFKIVIIGHSRKRGHVMLYSLRSNCWRHICRELPSWIGPGYYQQRGTLFNGVLHWIVVDKRNVQNVKPIMLAFDLVNEGFRVLPLPEALNQAEYCFRLTSEYGGCLRLFGTERISYFPSSKIELWEMKEYGVKESWCKVFSPSLPRDWNAVSDYGNPLVTWGDNVDRFFCFKERNNQIELELVPFPMKDYYYQGSYYSRQPKCNYANCFRGSFVSIEAIKGV